PKANIAVEPEMSTKAIEKYLSLEDPVGREFVYVKEQVKSSEVTICLAVLDATSSYLRRGAPLETLEKSLTWKKPKPPIEKEPIL
ncbi:hypothetical protein HAX54_000128, partial [Datura stramonium]|nr:hypothetical protein [Datura stramonium]